MKATDLKNLRVKEVQDLNKMVQDKKKDLMKVYPKISSGKGKDVKIARNLRKDIAKILTIAREKEILKKETK